jgi:UDP-3-O-[3-hydroxymyristoyl] N-acetylglucosamine deacetylase
MDAQRTLRRQVSCVGIGLHSGRKVTLSLKPAPVDHGIRFRRTDLGAFEVPATVHHLAGIQMATGLACNDVSVETVEHLLSALVSANIDNVLIELNSPEVPIMDGSAAPFVAAVDQAGIVVLPAARRYIQVLKPVRVAKGDSYGELRPHLRGLRIETEIEFDHPLIGRQSLAVEVEPDAFRRELARARTFGFMNDVAKLWSAGYALGASLENTVVVAENRVLNAEGLRYADEFVRHKAVDAIGDLALAGAPLLGAYRSVRGGHKLNHAVVTALMSDPGAWVYVEMPEPARRQRGHAELATGFAAPAYGPDLS